MGTAPTAITRHKLSIRMIHSPQELGKLEGEQLN